MGRKYKIYKIDCVNGHYYIGYTIQDLGERLRQHIMKALCGDAKDHSFYNDIRRLGKGSFSILKLDETNNRHNAMLLEKKYIKKYQSPNSYNLSSGGIDDASCGGKIFWQGLKENPEEKAAYLKKLSDRKKEKVWTDYENLSKKALEWRRKNPKKAYRMSYRAIRIANKNRNVEPAVDDRPLKEKLMWKHKRGDMTRKNAYKQWETMTNAEKVEIGRKISIAQKERMKSIAVLPDFKQEEWPYAKATVLRKIRNNMTREEIILDAIKNVESKGSHWSQVKANLENMGIAL